MITWQWEQALARRLWQSYLIESEQDPVAVVRRVCGLQAQLPSAAELGVAVRTTNVDRADLQACIVDGRLVRTYAMRGTAYVLAGQDVPLFMAAMRFVYGGRGWFKRFGLEAEQAKTLFVATAKILDNRILDRAELIAALRAKVGNWVFTVFDETLATFVVAAAYAGVLAYGPARGAKTTFTRPQAQPWSESDQAAAQEVLRRYVMTYGPVTRHDIARWLAVTPGEAQTLVDLISDTVELVQLFDKPAVVEKGSVVPEVTKGHTVSLLPQYDAYILHTGPLEKVVPSTAKPLIAAYRSGRFEGAAGVPVLLVDGIFAGTWRREVKGKHLVISLQPLRPLTAAQRDAAQRRAEHIADFYDKALLFQIDNI